MELIGLIATQMSLERSQVPGTMARVSSAVLRADDLKGLLNQLWERSWLDGSSCQLKGASLNAMVAPEDACQSIVSILTCS